MDPLSIIASSIAIAQGGDRLISLLSKTRRLQEAPTEVDHLIIEVSQAKTTLASLQGIVLAAAQRGVTGNFETLDRILHQYAALIDSIQAIIAKHLVTSRSQTKQSAEAVPDGHGRQTGDVSRWGWATKKSQVMALRDKVSVIRELIMAEMAVLSSNLQLEMQISLEDKLDQHSRMLDHILLIQSRETISTTPAPTAQTTAAASMSPHILRQGTYNPCKSCPCRCHFRSRLSVTRWGYLAGSMALDTTGAPFLSQTCDRQAICKQPSVAMARGTFYLPHWLATRVIFVTLTKGPAPSVSLSFARVFPAHAEFFQYIQLGRCEDVQKLLETGRASPGDMVEASYGTLSALLFALNNSQIPVCKILLSWGADPHLEHDTSLTSTATDMAWNMSHEGNLSRSLDKQDRLENIFPFPPDLEKRGFSRLTRILLGLSGCDLDAALKVATAADFLSADSHGRTVTHWAGWNGAADHLRKILLAGADPDVTDPAGRVPLHFSSMTLSSACTQVLAELGADVSRPDNFGETPLHCACSAGRLVNVACLLSAGANPNIASHKGTTPLMSAVLGGSIAAVRMLLKHDVDVEATDAAGESAATLAVWLNRHDMVHVLSSTGRARLDVITGSGRTVLHTAAQFGDLDMMKTLLNIPLGTCCPTELNHEGLTALDKFRERTNPTQELREAFLSLVMRVPMNASSTSPGTSLPLRGFAEPKTTSADADTVSISSSEDDFYPALESFDQAMAGQLA